MITISSTSLITIHRRRNQGGRGGHGPPRFQNICFRPPQISTPEINQHWLEITFKHVLYSFIKCNLQESFLLEVCADIATWNAKNLSTITGCPFYFGPPQVMTCSSASAIRDTYSTSSQLESHSMFGSSSMHDHNDELPLLRTHAG